MASLLANLRSLLFSVTGDQALAPAARFVGGEEVARERLSSIVSNFCRGYRASLLEREPQSLSETLSEQVESANLGFAFEGAGMGLGIVDALLPASLGKLQPFLVGPGKDHEYLVFVGAGWAIGRIPFRRRSRLEALRTSEPGLHWLVLDGLGFYVGYHDVPMTLQRGERPAYLRGYERRAFDQGLGRSLWFSQVGDRSLISSVIDSLQVERRADLWSGVGLACAYAGGESARAINRLFKHSGVFASAFAQGVAFAATARWQGDTPNVDTDLACRIVWDCEVAELAHKTLAEWKLLRGAQSLDSETPKTPVYELWRDSIGKLHARQTESANAQPMEAIRSAATTTRSRPA